MSQAQFYQHIYTSSRVRRGYYTIRISQEVKNHIVQLERKGIYKSPKGNFPSRPDEEELKSFPVQFTHYLIQETGQSVFCRAVYRGRDNHSRSPRYGNYFSHSIILQEHLPEGLLPFEVFKNFPWEEKLDPTDDVPGSEAVREQIGAKSFALENSIDQYISNLRFLWESESNRESIFLQIVDLIINGIFQGDKKILIVEDRPEFLPLWMNSLCLVFPPEFYQEFSFSSYYRDPLNCHSNVIGTVVQEENVQLINGEASKFYVFEIATPKEVEAKNAYTKQIEKVLNELKIGSIERAGRLLQKTFVFVRKEGFRKIGKEFNRPFDFLQELERLLGKEGATFENEILSFFERYPKRKFQIESELESRRPDLYAEFLKDCIRKNSFRTFENIYNKIRENQALCEAYFNDLLSYWLKSNTIYDQKERPVEILLQYSAKLNTQLREELFEKAFYFAITSKAFKEEGKSTLARLKDFDSDAFEKYKETEKVKVYFDYKAALDLLTGQVRNSIDKQANLIWTLRKLTEYWKSAKEIFGQIEVEGWINELIQILENNKIELDPKEITLENAEYFDRFFKENDADSRIRALEEAINIDKNLIEFYSLIHDWKEKKEDIAIIFKKIETKKKHVILQALSPEEQKYLIERNFEWISNNSHTFDTQKYKNFFTEFVEKYKQDKLPFVEKLIRLKGNQNRSRIDSRAKAEIAKTFLLHEPWLLDKSSAKYLCELSSQLITEHKVFLPDHVKEDLGRKLLEVEQEFDLNLDLPIIEYRRSARRLAFKDKDELYDSEGLKTFILKNKEVDQNQNDLVTNILTAIVKNRFNFEDFLQLFSIFRNTEISEESYMPAIIFFIEKYYNSPLRLGDRNWLKEQLTIAVLLSGEAPLFELLRKNLNLREAFGGGGLDYSKVNRICYWVKNQTSKYDLLETFLEETNPGYRSRRRL